jgi:hypothetical protein
MRRVGALDQAAVDIADGTGLALATGISSEGRAMRKSPRQEVVPEDFVAHLQARLGLDDEATALATLRDWLSSYQPGPTALARATGSPSLHRSAA